MEPRETSINILEILKLLEEDLMIIHSSTGTKSQNFGPYESDKTIFSRNGLD